MIYKVNKTNGEEVLKTFSSGDTIKIKFDNNRPLISLIYDKSTLKKRNYDRKKIYPKYLVIDNEIGVEGNSCRIFTKNLYEACMIMGLNYNDYNSFDDMLNKENLSILGVKQELANYTYNLYENIFCPNCFKCFHQEDLLFGEESEKFNELFKDVCDEYGDDSVKTRTILSIISNNSKKGLNYKCPHCSKKFNLDKPISLSNAPKFIPKYVDIRFSRNIYTISAFGIMNSYGIIYNKNGEAVTDNDCPNKNTDYGNTWKIQSYQAKIQICFNTKSGQTYVTPFKTRTGKIIKRKGVYNPKTLKNVTYGGGDTFEDDYCAFDNIFNGDNFVKDMIYKTFSKVLNISDDYYEVSQEIENSDKGEITLAILALKNRMPSMPFNLLYRIISESSQNNGKEYRRDDKVFLKNIDRSLSQEDVMRKIMEYSKCKDYSWAQNDIKYNILNAVTLHIIRRAGFTCEENIAAIYELMKKDSNGYNVFSLIKSDLFRHLIKHMGNDKRAEEIALNAFKEYMTNIFFAKPKWNKANNMYVRINHSSKKNELNNPLLYSSGDIETISKNLKSLYDEIHFENFKLSYTERDFALLCNVCGNYDFKLVKDTNELVRAGQELKIDVSNDFEHFININKIHRNKVVIGYNLITRKPSFYIVFVKRMMITARAKYDLPIVGDAATAFIEWASELKLSGFEIHCQDYLNASEDESTIASLPKRDYHTLEIGNDGKVHLVS